MNGKAEKAGNSKIPRINSRTVSDLSDNIRKISISAKPPNSEPNTFESTSSTRSSTATPSSNTPKEQPSVELFIPPVSTKFGLGNDF